MAKTLPEDQTMWLATADEYFEVVIVEKGTGGHVFKTGKKPRNPYVVRDDDQRLFVVGYDSLHDSPVEASIDMARLAKAEGLASNPSGPGDEDDEEDEEDSPDSESGDGENSEDDEDEEDD